MTATQAAPAPILWALVQTEPRVAILAVSHDRARIRAEGRILAEMQNEIGNRTYHHWRIAKVEPRAI